MARIGLFGGTFNPIHVGHLTIAEEACLAAGLDKVVFIPSGDPYQKPASELAGRLDRLEMTRLAVHGDERFEVIYSFVEDTTGRIVSLRLNIARDEQVPSVSELFPCAFVFENEMHDLYGVHVTGISIDFQGGFYHVHYPQPMAQASEKPAKAKPAQDEA